jgi:hypothetical protein
MMIAGLDPGSAHLAVAIAEPSTPMRLVHVETFVVGERIACAPRRLENGEIVYRHRRIVRLAHVNELSKRVVAILLEHRVDRLAVETLDTVYVRTDRPTTASSIATACGRTRYGSGWIESRALDAGIEIIPVNASAWRSRVGGKLGADGVLDALKLAFENLPWLDEHQIDAVGVVRWLAMPPPAPRHVAKPKAQRDPNAPKPPLAREVRKQQNRAEMLAARDEAGCICGVRKGRHKAECPLGIAAHERAQAREKKERMPCPCGKVPHRTTCPVYIERAEKQRAKQQAEIARWRAWREQA